MNFTIEQEYKRLTNLGTSDEEILNHLVYLTGRTKTSIIATLAAMNLRRRTRVSKVTGEKPRTKIDIRKEIEEKLGTKLPGLELSPKTTLLKLLEQI